MPVLTLHSFVGVDPDVVSLPLFRQFLRHYSDHGIDRFVFDLHSNTADAGRARAFCDAARPFGAVIRHVVYGPYVSHQNHVTYVNSFMTEYGAETEWCLLADADEFVRFPNDAVTFFRSCDDAGCNVVVGTLLDRLCLDPPFPEIHDEEPIDDQFPWSYPLTRQVRKGVDRKIVAFKGKFTCIEGKHGLQEEPPGLAERERTVKRLTDRITIERWRARLDRLYYALEPGRSGVRRWSGRLEVHHFAWDALLRKKMELRAAMPGLTHRKEIENILVFLRQADPSATLRPHLLKASKLRG